MSSSLLKTYKIILVILDKTICRLVDLQKTSEANFKYGLGFLNLRHKFQILNKNYITSIKEIAK